MDDVVRFRLAIASAALILMLGLFPLAYVSEGGEKHYQSLTMRKDPGAEAAGQWLVDDGMRIMAVASASAWLWVGGLVAAGVWVVGDAWSKMHGSFRTAAMIAAPLLSLGAFFLFPVGLDVYYGSGANIYAAPNLGVVTLPVAIGFVALWAWNLERFRQWKERKRVASTA